MHAGDLEGLGKEKTERCMYLCSLVGFSNGGPMSFPNLGISPTVHANLIGDLNLAASLLLSRFAWSIIYRMLTGMPRPPQSVPVSHSQTVSDMATINARYRCFLAMTERLFNHLAAVCREARATPRIVVRQQRVENLRNDSPIAVIGNFPQS